MISHMDLVARSAGKRSSARFPAKSPRSNTMDIILALIILVAIAAVITLIVYVICDDNRQMDDKIDNYQAQNERDKRMIKRELKK